MSKNALLPYVLYTVFILHSFAVSDAVFLKMQQGTLEGTVRSSRNGTKFHAFLSIPFAKPPVGELRLEAPLAMYDNKTKKVLLKSWKKLQHPPYTNSTAYISIIWSKITRSADLSVHIRLDSLAPQSPDPWTGVRDATKPPPSCIQKFPLFGNVSEEPIRGQEDCLYLNVYTPAKALDDLLPVLVFIHGGAFALGSASNVEPDYFMDHDVVVVFIQYRLNLFGFLSAGDEILPGNYGMKDQIAALKWIQKNIADFKGDPKRVTVFGVSAGGASVHLLMHSPLSKGLFQRAISQSGTALALWAQQSPWLALQKSRTVGILAGCPVESSAALKKCLKKMPAEKFATIHDKFYVWDFHPLAPFSIVVEPQSVKNAFLTENPWEQNVQNKVPWIVGTTSAEGTAFVSRVLSNKKLLDELNENLERLLPILIPYLHWSTGANIEAITETLKQFYFDENRTINLDLAKNLVDLVSDGFFTFDCVEAALRHTDKLFVYIYDHKNEHSFAKFFGDELINFGASHGDDQCSLFPMPMYLSNMTCPLDIAVSERLINYWVHFAATGNPSDDGTWLPSEKSAQLDYLHISTEKDTMKKGLTDDRYKLWKNLINQRMHIASSESFIIKDEL